MGIAWRNSGRWNLSGPLDQNRDVDWSSSVEKCCMRGKCRTVWTNPLLFYWSIFPTHGVRNDSPWLPSRELGGERLDVVRIGNHSRYRDPLVVHRNSLGKVSFCQELIEGNHRERINKRREKTLNKNPST